jgi:phosphomannomutase
MNRVVVGQAAAALATYLLDHDLAGGKVIIGFDARRNSDVFARDTAEIMTGAGFQTLITAGPLPTPVVAFGIRHLGCVAGVVVTASHNPPQDNGYKVYLGDGSQIVPPADAEISARIDAVAKHSLNDVPRSHSYVVLGPELVDAYVDRIASWVPGGAPRQLALGLHTVARRWRSLVDRVVTACGFLPPT